MNLSTGAFGGAAADYVRRFGPRAWHVRHVLYQLKRERPKRSGHETEGSSSLTPEEGGRIFPLSGLATTTTVLMT